METAPSMLASILEDVRFSARLLGKAPGHTAVLVLTLALGIGATTTIFSVVHSVLIKPLPYPRPGELVRVYTESPSLGMDHFSVSPPEYWDLSRSCRSCAAVGAVGTGTASIAGSSRSVRVDAAYVTHTMLPLLGVSPVLGRFFTPEEDLPPADPQAFSGEPVAVIISHGVWQRAFAGDPQVIGTKVLLDAIPVTVVGVMPEGFDFPGRMEAWVPVGLHPQSQRRGNHWLQIYTRLKPGVSLAQFREELGALTAAWSAGELASKHHIDARTHPITAYQLHAEMVRTMERPLWLLQAAVLFVLLIAVANVTNLLLARAEARNREIAVRHALGASRGRLTRMLLTESLVLGALGGLLGVLVAVWTVDLTVSLLPPQAPRLQEISLDGASLAFAVVCAVGCSVLFGLAPIIHTRKSDLHGSLKDGSRAATGSASRLRIRRALVTAEIALAVVLVVACGVMVASFIRLQNVELGFKPENVLTFEVEVPSRTYPADSDTLAFFDRLQGRLTSLPGVTQVGLVTAMPPERGLNANDLGLPGRTPKEGEPPFNVDFWTGVGPGGLEAMGARLVRGRFLDASDAAGAPPVVMINEAFADKFFPGQDPVGQLIDMSPWRKKDSPGQTVVGVVASWRNQGIDRPSGTEVFYAIHQLPQIDGTARRTMQVALRRTTDAAGLAPAVYKAVAELDPSLAISRVRTLDEAVWEGVARPRFLTFLLSAFAFLALFLAGIGIYGVMAFSVSQRTHELGIRMALGAEPAQVRGMVLRQGAVLAATGLAAGAVAALALQLAVGPAVAEVLYSDSLAQPLLVLGVCAVVGACAVVASWIPARRATEVPPSIALRAE